MRRGKTAHEADRDSASRALLARAAALSPRPRTISRHRFAVDGSTADFLEDEWVLDAIDAFSRTARRFALGARQRHRRDRGELGRLQPLRGRPRGDERGDSHALHRHDVRRRAGPRHDRVLPPERRVRRAHPQLPAAGEPFFAGAARRVPRLHETDEPGRRGGATARSISRTVSREARSRSRSPGRSSAISSGAPMGSGFRSAGPLCRSSRS